MLSKIRQLKQLPQDKKAVRTKEFGMEAFTVCIGEYFERRTIHPRDVTTSHVRLIQNVSRPDKA